MNPYYQPTFDNGSAPPVAIAQPITGKVDAQYAQAPATSLIPYPINVVQFKSQAEDYLKSQSWPTPMIEVFLKNLPKIAIRFFICDDSGSMGAEDGKTSIGYQGKFR